MKLHCGDCLTVLPTLPADSIETCITDPPYGLSSGPTKYLGEGKGGGFMGKDWDHGVPGVQFWREVLRVLKPGAMLLAFGGTRTFHRLTCAIEDAGFEIRDCMCWLYGSGFPKSLDISKAIDRAAGAEREVVGQRDTLTGVDKNSNTFMSSPRIMDITAPSTAAAKQWQGWGTALKPAVELICVAMKPLDGTFAENAEKWGTAGINIDGCRVGGKKWENPRGGIWSTDSEAKSELIDNPLGRWPANLILDEESARALDEMSGERSVSGAAKTGDKATARNNGMFFSGDSSGNGNLPNDSGGASRFFYTAKADRREREDGLHGFEHGQRDESRKEGNPGGDNPRNRGLQKRQNTHPTVKPLSLMRYLCRLTRTPSGGTILDPFMGSGTTGIAAIQSGRDFIGIELQEEYFKIAKARIKGACPLLMGGIE